MLSDALLRAAEELRRYLDDNSYLAPSTRARAEALVKELEEVRVEVLSEAPVLNW